VQHISKKHNTQASIMISTTGSEMSTSLVPSYKKGLCMLHYSWILHHSWLILVSL